MEKNISRFWNGKEKDVLEYGDIFEFNGHFFEFKYLIEGGGWF